MSGTDICRLFRCVRRLLPALVAVSIVVALSGSAYPNPQTELVSGSMELSTSDRMSGSIVSLRPGQAQDTGCTLVRNAGTLPTVVRMYGTTEGTGLDRFITLEVTLGGFGGPPSPSCARFVADPQDRGMGPGVVYRGSLRDFPDDYASGLEDSSAPWSPGEAHAYRISVRLLEVNAAQGLTASQTFTWETRQLDALPPG